MSEKLKAETPIYSALFPPEYWELIELVMACCPEEALKSYRSLLIGKGKGQPKLIKAQAADRAIRAAYYGHYGTCDQEHINKQIALRMVTWPETAEDHRRRQEWYKRCGWPVIFVRHRDQEWYKHLEDFAGCDMRLLEYDDTGVDRLPIPKHLGGKSDQHDD